MEAMKKEEMYNAIIRERDSLQKRNEVSTKLINLLQTTVALLSIRFKSLEQGSLRLFQNYRGQRVISTDSLKCFELN